MTVQLSPEDLDFELSLRLSGFGLDQMTGRTGSLRVSESFCGTGLWHLDQLVPSDLLLAPVFLCGGCGILAEYHGITPS